MAGLARSDVDFSHIDALPSPGVRRGLLRSVGTLDPIMVAIRSGTVLGGTWDGHPGGEMSGYELMDLCYPCSPGAYSVLGPVRAPRAPARSLSLRH